MTKKLLVAVTLLIVGTLHAEVTSPLERVRETIEAMNKTPDEYERYAQTAYAPAMLQRTTAGQRKAMINRLHGDFGTLTASGVRRESPTHVKVSIAGSTGLRGVLELELEADAPYRIAGFGIDAGGDDEGPSPPPVPINGAMSTEELSKKLDDYLQSLTKSDAFAGVVLVARDGQPLFEKGYGLANRGDAVPNKPATRFDIGSINKFFTKAAIGQLLAQNKLALGDTIGKLLPDFPNADARRATVEQLLEHRAGLGNLFSPDLEQISRARFRSNHDWYVYAAPKPMQFEPGAKRMYCNTCYVVLGEIIERLSGQPYEQYIEKNVFAPAGMKATGFFDNDEVLPNVATGYTKRNGPLRTNAFSHGASGSAAGGAFSTAADLLAFDRALRAGKLLDRQHTGWFFEQGEDVAMPLTGGIGYAGGAAGINAIVESDGTWTAIALANIDPPAAESLGKAIHQALTKR